MTEGSDKPTGMNSHTGRELRQTPPDVFMSVGSVLMLLFIIYRREHVLDCAKKLPGCVRKTISTVQRTFKAIIGFPISILNWLKGWLQIIPFSGHIGGLILAPLNFITGLFRRYSILKILRSVYTWIMSLLFGIEEELRWETIMEEIPATLKPLLSNFKTKENLMKISCFWRLNQPDLLPTGFTDNLASSEFSTLKRIQRLPDGSPFEKNSLLFMLLSQVYSELAAKAASKDAFSGMNPGQIAKTMKDLGISPSNVQENALKNDVDTCLKKAAEIMKKTKNFNDLLRGDSLKDFFHVLLFTKLYILSEYNRNTDPFRNVCDIKPNETVESIGQKIKQKMKEVFNGFILGDTVKNDVLLESLETIFDIKINVFRKCYKEMPDGTKTNNDFLVLGSTKQSKTVLNLIDTGNYKFGIFVA